MAASIRRGAARIPLAIIALMALTPASRSQDTFPSKPVHLLVPFPPGGAVDIIARTLADELGKRWPVNIIIENRPGAGGTIAADVAAKAPPDGYTIVIVASGHAIVPFLYPKLPYDVFSDFTPITLLGNSPNLALVRADSPIKTLADLIAAARAKPGQLSYGHAGNGTSPHLAGELLKVTAKIDIIAVPYKGGAPALNDLLGGHIPLTFNNVPESIAMIQSAALRPLAVTTAKRTPILPDVPTIDESGLKGYDTGVWWVLLAPAGLAPDVKAKLYRDSAEAMKAPAVKERFQTLGATPIGGTPEEVAALIHTDYEKWGPIIKAAGIVAE
ncbi:MAG TPA: tripartite tricarboxylate transporter substrate binding protein [Xanthobacteraceae bacterium]|jgi:tripartite-type tricarboxylate transporter receptor subunit TctC|nr:tripartite tricarboxylate transporter substrate binding protein [Xanthobacteraceae bacterium]